MIPNRSSRLWILIALAVAWLAWLLTLPPRPSAWIVVVSGVPLLVFASWLLHLRAREPWRQFVRKTIDFHALSAVLLVALGLQFEDTHGITTDGVVYFSHLRSIIFDGDLDIAAEFDFLDQPPRPNHVVPIGPLPIWLPFYLAVAATDAIGRSIGLWAAPADSVALGLTLPYVRAAIVSSFAAGAVGLLTLQGHLRQAFDKGVACVATLLVFGATPLVWYMVYEPSMTHAVSFGFVAIFVVFAARWTSVAVTRRQALILGALLGAAFISRPQEALFALFPAVLLLASDASLRDRVAAGGRLAAWAFVGALPFLVAQAIEAAIVLSRESYVLTGDQGYLNFFHSRVDDTLWSSWHGFLSWSPAAYVALVGTIAYLSRDKPWAIATLLIVFVMAWVNGSTSDWAAGWSFGGRRFIGCLVILAPGLALIVQQLTRRPMVAIGLLALVAVTWNQWLVTQYASGMVPVGQAISFGQIVRQQAVVATRPPFFYPFAFPANVWFAWRTGLPVDRYDLLSAEELRPSINLVFDATATPFLTNGWGPRAADDIGAVRWIEGTSAELVLPLEVRADSPTTIEVSARTRLLDPPTRVAVTLTVNDRQSWTFSPDAQAPSTVTLVVPAGSELFTRGFNRFVFEKPDGSPPVALYRVVIMQR